MSKVVKSIQDMAGTRPSNPSPEVSVALFQKALDTLSVQQLSDSLQRIDGSGYFQLTTNEALTAGQLVNIYSDTGAFFVRKSQAIYGYTRRVDGMVLTNYGPGQLATIWVRGDNTFASALVPGDVYLSPLVAGGITQDPSLLNCSGYIVQRVGYAISPSTYRLQIGAVMLVG